MNKILYGLRGRLLSNASSSATALEVDSAFADALAAELDAGDTTMIAVSSGYVFELMEVFDITDNFLAVVRTTPKSFPAGSTVDTAVTAAALIEEIVNSNVIDGLSVAGTGVVNVTQVGGEYRVNVPALSLSGQGDITVQGAWPSFTIGRAGLEGGCCPTDGQGGTGGSLGSLTGEYPISVQQTGNDYRIFIENVQLTAGTGINITGSYPFFTISTTGASGGSTTVAVGQGLTLTGSPSVNPTISITNTGVTPGTYGGIEVNARGQITSLPAGFSPVSQVSSTNGIETVVIGGALEVNGLDAEVGVRGVIALADPIEELDANDESSAVSPALLAAVLQTQSGFNPTGVKSNIAEADAAYTNIISGTAQPLELLASEKALIHVEVTVADLTTPVNIPSYGLGVFTALPARIEARRIIPQAQQSMSFLLNGPLAATDIAAVTTALGANESVIGYSIWVEKFSG